MAVSVGGWADTTDITSKTILQLAKLIEFSFWRLETNYQLYLPSSEALKKNWFAVASMNKSYMDIFAIQEIRERKESVEKS